jgi:hypothetical protein
VSEYEKAELVAFVHVKFFKVNEMFYRWEKEIIAL